MKRILAVSLSLLLALGSLSPMATVAAQDDVIYVLAIGNSFSQDAVTYLRDISVKGGVDLRVANLYIGGCSLQTHWSNANSNAPKYSFQTFYQTPQTLSSYSIKQALESQDWDYVTFQQVSQDSGRPETFEPYLTNLSNYVKNLEPNAKQYYHQTWAYEKDSSHSGFKNYNNDQTTMFEAIKSASAAAAAKLHMGLIPCGEAMQKARATTPFDYDNGGKSLNRDGYHASIPQGRYLLAAVWYEVFTGKNILYNNFTLSGISATELIALKQSASAAVAMYQTRKVSSIEKQSQPTKTVYLQNEALDTTGATLLINYDSGAKDTIPLDSSIVSGYNANVAGTQTLTINYSGKTASFQVKVVSRAAVDSLIKDIGTIKSGTTSITQLNALQKRYASLTPLEQSGVTNYSKLSIALDNAGISTTSSSGRVSTKAPGTAGTTNSSDPASTDTTPDSSESSASLNSSESTATSASTSALNTVVSTESVDLKIIILSVIAALLIVGGVITFLLIKTKQKQSSK